MLLYVTLFFTSTSSATVLNCLKLSVTLFTRQLPSENVLALARIAMQVQTN